MQLDMLQEENKNVLEKAAVEISCEPCVKRHVRSIFMDCAMVSTRPTIDGRVSIDANHEFVVATSRYVVHTCRVIVPTGMYVVPAGMMLGIYEMQSKLGYDKMQKILSQLNQLKAKPEDEDINLKFLRALPSSWSQVALTLKTKEQQLAYEDFEQIEKLDLEEMVLKWQMAMLFVRVHKFEQKARRKIYFDKKESARFNKKKVRCYKCQQRGHFARECRAKGGNNKQRYSSFKIKEIGKKEEDLKSLITVDTLVDWTDHDDESDEVITAKEFGMIASCDSKDAIKEGAAKIYNLITGANSEEANTSGDAREFALMGVTFEVNTNDLASSDSSAKSSERKPNDSTSCASTSIVSTSVNEAEIKSNVGAPTQEPIIVQDLLNFSCNSFDKNENTSRTSCNKNGYFNKKAVPTDKPKVFAPVPTGRPNRLFLVPTDRGYFPSVISTWWKNIARPMPHFTRPTSSYFQTYTPYVPTMYYTHMKYGSDRWATAVKSSAGGKVTFGGGEGRITRKGTIRTPTLDFENVYYVKELQKFNLFSISQICDKKNQVLFTDTECLELSKDFKLPDDSIVVLKIPRKHNLYTINLNDIYPRGNLACLVAHASFDEFVKWHRQMGHVNYKNMNRLVKGNLVRGLPPKLFKHDHTCVACCKGKKHKASYKAIHAVISISEPLQLLHIDLFGPTSIRSIDHKYYCLVITDDYSGKLVEQKVKAIRYDNGTEFKNAHMIDLCGSKGIKWEYSNPRAPQQNRVAKRKNRTFIEAARTMVSVTSPHNKTPYALLTGHIPSVSHFKPFGYHVTILNTSDHLGKFDGKADEGYIVGYFASNKAYRVYNVPNKRVEESMNLRFLKEKPNVQGLGYECYFDLDYLTDSLGYKHVQDNQSAGTQGATTNSADTSDDEVNNSPFHSADEIFQKELARLKGQEQRVTSNAKSLGLGFANNAEELQTQTSAKTVPPGCIPGPTSNVPVPPGSLPVPTGSIPVPADATMVSTDDVLVHTSSLTDSIFIGEPTTRFSCPSDLGNHDPSPGIFSSSSY
nr:putative ribonuclease H-like domain-containing protein [Tanacetum cinerariifolium]